MQLEPAWVQVKGKKSASIRKGTLVMYRWQRKWYVNSQKIEDFHSWFSFMVSRPGNAMEHDLLICIIEASSSACSC